MFHSVKFNRANNKYLTIIVNNFKTQIHSNNMLQSRTVVLGRFRFNKKIHNRYFRVIKVFQIKKFYTAILEIINNQL
jgi:hypothetical protein